MYVHIAGPMLGLVAVVAKGLRQDVDNDDDDELQPAPRLILVPDRNGESVNWSLAENLKRID